MICPLTRAHLAALAASGLCLLLLFVKISLAPLPLAAFVLCCMVAPFFPGLKFYLPVVRRGRRDAAGIALTLNGGPDPRSTPHLLELLARHGVVATFFVTGEEAARYPGIVRQILDNGHTVGNHAFRHAPLPVFRGRMKIETEIVGGQKCLKPFGVTPLAFTPPVGIVGPGLWRVLLERGMYCVSASCRDGIWKMGPVAGLADRLLTKVSPGDIVLLHDTDRGEGSNELLLGECSAFLEGLRQKGLGVIPLEKLVEKEVMLRERREGAPRPVETFYNDLAVTYDHEQFNTAVSIAKRKEGELVSASVATLFSGGERVLEIGAGTGIYTLPIARVSREVVAVDISAKMLEALERKAVAEGVTNIRTRLMDVETTPLEGTFSVICALSSLEYMTDLPGLFRRLYDHLEPGGAIYCIMARRSFLRFFVQLGNAMRQGLWLKAHSRREMERMLRDAGFRDIHIDSHLFTLRQWGGMLLQVRGRRPEQSSRPFPADGAER